MPSRKKHSPKAPQQRDDGQTFDRHGFGGARGRSKPSADLHSLPGRNRERREEPQQGSDFVEKNQGADYHGGLERNRAPYTPQSAIGRLLLAAKSSLDLKPGDVAKFDEVIEQADTLHLKALGEAVDRLSVSDPICPAALKPGRKALPAEELKRRLEMKPTTEEEKRQKRLAQKAAYARRQRALVRLEAQDEPEPS